VNCCVAPAATLTTAGVTAIAVSVFIGAVTVSAAVPLMPLKAAVTVDVPAATPVASPDTLMVAVAVEELVQLAVVLTSPEVPSLYVAIAVNCWVAPTAMLGVAGVTEIAVSVFCVTFVTPPHPTATTITGSRKVKRRQLNRLFLKFLILISHAGP
jgi:hypothetical protein